MSKTYSMIAAALAAGLLLTGCSTGPKNLVESSSKPSQSALPGEPTKEQIEGSMYPGGMPKMVDPASVTNLTVEDQIDSAKAKEAYAWVASFAVLSFNDSTLQQMDTFRQYGLLAFADYFTPYGLKIAEAHFSQYAKNGDYASLDSAMQYIGYRGLFTVLPSKGYKYLNSPVFDQFQYGAATIEDAGVNEGLTTYKVTVPVTARLLWQDEADNKKYETTFNRTFEIWVVETGDAAKPYLIDSWNENPLSWTAKEVK